MVGVAKLPIILEHFYMWLNFHRPGLMAALHVKAGCLWYKYYLYGGVSKGEFIIRGKALCQLYDIKIKHNNK